MKNKAVLWTIIFYCLFLSVSIAYPDDRFQQKQHDENAQKSQTQVKQDEKGGKAAAQTQSQVQRKPQQKGQPSIKQKEDEAGKDGAAAEQSQTPQQPKKAQQNNNPKQPATVSPGPGGTSTTPPPSRPPARTRRPPIRPGSYAGGMISLNFDDADVFSVIQTIFGEILRVNYVVEQRVKGRVTFRSVAPIPADKVLPVMEVILRQNGIGIVEEGGLYRIVPIGDVSREPAEVFIGRDTNKITVKGRSIIQIIPISYISSSEIIKLVTPFLTETAIAIDIPTMNQIVLVDTDTNVKRILNLINMFDGEMTKKKRPQVNVYHIQNSKAKDVAAVLQQIFSTSVTSSSPTTTTVVSSSPEKTDASKGSRGAASQMRRAAPPSPPVSSGGSASGGSGVGSLISSATKIIADENLNLLVVLALPEDYEVIKNAIEKIDIIPRQVLLEGVIAEITLKDDLKLGVSWALQFKPGGMGGVLGAVDGVVGFDVPGATSTSTTGTGTFNFAGTVGRDFKTVIDMLATTSKAKLLAVPHVLVSDNKEARIQVGEQVPIVTSETFGSTTVAPQRTIQYKDLGIILKVKPRINEGGLVSLDIVQEVSSYEKTKLFDDEDYIIVKKTEAATNLVVQDGHTIIIGGLIRDDISTARGGIPFLSKIPVLGYLFGSTTDEDHRKELIILLTPRVIRNHKEASAVTSDYVGKITETGKGHLKKDDLLKRIKPDDRDSSDGSDTTTVPEDGNGDRGKDGHNNGVNGKNKEGDR